MKGDLTTDRANLPERISPAEYRALLHDYLHNRQGWTPEQTDLFFAHVDVRRYGKDGRS